VYSETFKKRLVERMLMPNARPKATLARKAAVAEGTLYRWLNEATLTGVSADRPDDKSTSTAKPPHSWTAEEKLAVVLEAAGVPEAELGAFLRRRGVHEAQLAEWREQVNDRAVAALRGTGRGDRKAAAAEGRRVRAGTRAPAQGQGAGRSSGAPGAEKKFATTAQIQADQGGRGRIEGRAKPTRTAARPRDSSNCILDLVGFDPLIERDGGRAASAAAVPGRLRGHPARDGRRACGTAELRA
jgi:transposase-like protein